MCGNFSLVYVDCFTVHLSFCSSCYGHIRLRRKGLVKHRCLFLFVMRRIVILGQLLQPLLLLRLRKPKRSRNYHSHMPLVMFICPDVIWCQRCSCNESPVGNSQQRPVESALWQRTEIDCRLRCHSLQTVPVKNTSTIRSAYQHTPRLFFRYRNIIFAELSVFLFIHKSYLPVLIIQNRYCSLDIQGGPKTHESLHRNFLMKSR